MAPILGLLSSILAEIDGSSQNIYSNDDNTKKTLANLNFSQDLLADGGEIAHAKRVIVKDISDMSDEKPDLDRRKQSKRQICPSISHPNSDRHKLIRE